MRTLNLRLLAILMVGIALSAGAAVALHSVQVRRHAGVLLQQAERAREQGQEREAIDYLQRYVLLASAGVPRADALAELGMLQAQVGRLVQAYVNLEAGLRENSENSNRDDVRRQLIEVAFKLGRYTDARQHILALLEKFPNDGKLLDQLAQCQQVAGDYGPAAETLRLAIQSDPHQLDSYARLSAMLRTRMNQPRESQEILDQMVENNSSEARAYVLRGTDALLRATTRVGGESGGGAGGTSADEGEGRTSAPASESLADARRALELAPESEESIQFAARCFLQNKLLDEAREQARRGLELHPKSPWTYALLADIELNQQSADLDERHRDEAILWLSRGLAVAPQQKDLLWNLARLLIEANRIEEAEKYIDRLQSAGYQRAALEFLRARILVQQAATPAKNRSPAQNPPPSEGSWLGASRKLESIRASLAMWPELMKEADFWLGRCYEELGKADLQLTAYRRAVGVDPTWIPARLGIANALRSTGRLDEALDEYRRIAALPGAPPAAQAQVARLTILSNLRRNASEQDWNQVEQSLHELDPESPQAVLLKAEVLLAREKDKEKGLSAAEKMLSEALERSPETLEYWLALASLAERREQFDHASQLLDRAQAQLGDVVALRLARARQLVRRLGPDARGALHDLARADASYSDGDRQLLEYGLAELAIATEDWAFAKRLCRQLAQQQPNDLRIRLLLFDVYYREQPADAVEQERQHAQMKQVLAEVREIEGAGPLWNYGEAIRLSLEAAQADSRNQPEARAEAYARAKEHLTQARMARPAWSRVWLLSAQIADAQKNHEAAISDYLKAIEFGEQDSKVVGRAVFLLFRQKRYTEADAIIRRQQDQQPLLSQEMIKLAAEVSLQLDDSERTLNMTKMVTEQTSDPEEYVWAGNILRLLGGRTSIPERRRAYYTDAENLFRKAIERDESASGPWVALIQLHGAMLRDRQIVTAAQADQLDEQLAGELSLARRNLKSDQAPMALAQALESIGRTREAEDEYRAALSASANKGPVLRRLADLCLRNLRFQEAEDYLTQMINPALNVNRPDREWAQRNQALLLVSRGGQTHIADVKHALAQIEKNLDGKPPAEQSPADLRVKAALKAMLPDRASRRDAVALLEDLLQRQPASVGDDAGEERLVLAQLYNSLGESSKATDQLRKLMASHGDKPRYVAGFAQLLLSRNEVSDAEVWISQLQKMAPQNFTTFSLSMEVLFRRERFDDLLREADQFVSDDRSDLTDRQVRRQRVAGLVESFAARLKAPAAEGTSASELERREKWSARLAEVAESLYGRESPTDALALSAMFGRQGRFSESLQLLNQNWSASRPEEIAVVTGTLLASTEATPDHFAQAEELLEAALDKHARPVTLLLALADVHSWQKRYDDAERLYREVLQNEARSAVALNNLALLLALRRRGGEEALSMIDRAIKSVGEDPILLDSRAMIYLALGDAERAMVDLVQAIDARPAAQYYFHQAQAAARLGRTDEARESLQKAAALGLREENLHPLERPGFLQLTRDLR
ncbi:MAG: tetratricopeptide repeat protein [Planctomycetaceae bacterium]